MAVPIGPTSRCVFTISDGLVRAIMEGGSANAFGFVESVDRLLPGIVIRVAYRADRGSDLLEREMLTRYH